MSRAGVSDVLARSAGIFRAEQQEHAQPGRHDVGALGHILANMVELAGTAVGRYRS